MEVAPGIELDLPLDIWEPLEPAVKALLIVQQSMIRELQVRVRDLEDRVNKNSSNSSRPPSSDQPWAKPVKKRKAKGRRPGGQQGHAPHLRQLLPLEKVGSVVDHFPAQCKHCPATLTEADAATAVDARRHQIVELPAIVPDVVEHRLHARLCPECCKLTRASIPAEVPYGNLGPRAQALVGVLTSQFRLSKRDVRELVRMVLGIAVSLGSIADIEHNVSMALKIPVNEVHEAIKKSTVAYQDETSWREANHKAYVWCAVSTHYAVYKIALSRGGEVARELLGGAAFLGHSVTDRYKAYNCYPMERRQICQAHLARDYQSIADREGPGRLIGEALCAEQHKMFKAWGQFKDGMIDRPELQKRINRIGTRIEILLERGVKCEDAKVAGRCKDVLFHREALWTFAHIEGVGPTNNEAERSVRKPVLWRKGSFGTQSPRGSRFAERMMTIIETCRRQGRNVFDFVITAMQAWIFDQPPPSLLVSNSN